MNVLNVNHALSLKIGGGTAERTYQMSRFLANNGVACTVLVLDIDDEENVSENINVFKTVKIPCYWKRFYVPKISWKLILEKVRDADIIHLMGHWSILNAIVYFAARFINKPYVVCPAGALPIFGRSAFLKKSYNYLIGRSIIENASAWIAVTNAEKKDFESYGITQNQVSVIPNGVDIDSFNLSNYKYFYEKYNLSQRKIILFMGRLNYIKGPDLLLEAFRKLNTGLPDYILVFAGPDGGMLGYLREQICRYGLEERVKFVGYISGDDKAAAYHCADLLVIPSRQEAMSIVALEAGICGTTVLLTDQCGFGEICGIDERLEVPANVKGISNGLSELLIEDCCLADVSLRLKEFTQKKYSWDVIVKDYISLYTPFMK